MTDQIIPDFPHIKANVYSLALRKPVFDVGINDAPYMVQPRVDGKQVTCPFYNIWKSMLQRAYCPKYHVKFPTYKNVTVCEEWHGFMAFRAWMGKQDWQGKQLDKDILVHGNKTYSPENCMFVSQVINKLLCDGGGMRGSCPLGVYFNKPSRRYLAQINRGRGVPEYIGLFGTPEEASEAYKKAKSTYVRKVADEQSEPLRSALYSHAEIIGK